MAESAHKLTIPPRVVHKETSMNTVLVSIIFTVLNSVLLGFLLIRQLREWKLVRMQQEKLELELKVLKEGRIRAVDIASSGQVAYFAPAGIPVRTTRHVATPFVLPNIDFLQAKDSTAIQDQITLLRMAYKRLKDELGTTYQVTLKTHVAPLIRRRLKELSQQKKDALKAEADKREKDD